MSQPIADFSSVTAFVLGDLILDRYWHGDSRRISREAPVPVVSVDVTEERAGGGANVALNMAALKAKTQLMGVVGTDQAGNALLSLLKKGAVNCASIVQFAEYRTVVKLRVLSRNQQLVRLDFEDNAHPMLASIPMDDIKKQIQGSDVMVVSDYGKSGLADFVNIISMAHDAKIPILIDPKSTDFTIYTGANLLTPNFEEFQAAIGKSLHREEDIIREGFEMVKRLKLQALLLTRGKHGMTLFQLGEEPFHLSAEVSEVYDVTGAGDTVIATIAVALGAGMDMRQATRLSNMAAGISVRHLGTFAVTSADLERCLLNRNEIASGGVMNDLQLIDSVATARREHKKIVFTNGCYDIFHHGHLATIEDAAKLGDYLIVAVNSDNSVRRLKGKKRPINALNDRMKILASLKAVDCVVSFDEDTTERLLQLIKPDVLAKGGDYRKDQVTEADFVESYGGEVVILKKVPNISTTDIINKSR